MPERNFTISGNIVDVVKKRIYKGIININNRKIESITETENVADQYILPGLIDAHVHIESSMVIPSEFARMAVIHGTVATVSDPHEIANVLGMKGVEFMIENGKKVPFKFFFGAPSCVPATPFETSGATISTTDIEQLMSNDDIKYLSEMMNFPGVIYNDSTVIEKLSIAIKNKKPVDGHAPGVSGDNIKKYILSGISTDHECFTIEEAEEKISHGMKIQIREGSAAKNFDALIDLLAIHPDSVMFCSDDKHPDDLAEGHINMLVKRALKKGFDFMSVLRACTFIPVKHYNLNVGLIQKNDAADFIIIDSPKKFNVLATYIEGVKVAEKGKTLIPSVNELPVNTFKATKISDADIAVSYTGNYIKVIKALESQLITEKCTVLPKNDSRYILNDTENDILKLVVMNRYQKSKPSVAFINGFNIKKGAIASTVAHDSHNIIAVGSKDADIIEAINQLISCKGGIAVVNEKQKHILALPVAGLMSADDGFDLAAKYEFINKKAKELGCSLNAPFMTLSFMALLVIPELKLSDKGLFDGTTFSFTTLEQHN